MSATTLVIAVAFVCFCILFACGPGPLPFAGTRQVAAEEPEAPGGSPVPASDDVPPDGLLFVFAAIGDSHIVGPIRTAAYDFSGRSGMMALNLSDRLLARYVGDINSHIPAVDFTFQLGDLTDNGKRTEFATARAILDSLHCPLYPVVGNHDNMQSDDKRGWRDFAGRESTDYSFDRDGFHFIVIDCTADPYVPPYVVCDSTLQLWIARDLALNSDKPTFVISHFNMWERSWNSHFELGEGYKEYEGMARLRDILERAGNVVAVINGHVHANRVEVHNGIYYIDVGATLVGRPSIRYFYVFPERIEVTYAYLSDATLSGRVEDLARRCYRCFDPAGVVDFIDGTDADKRFSVPVNMRVPAKPHLQGLPH
jgi:predicted phosphodiesterase